MTLGLDPETFLPSTHERNIEKGCFSEPVRDVSEEINVYRREESVCDRSGEKEELFWCRSGSLCVVHFAVREQMVFFFCTVKL